MKKVVHLPCPLLTGRFLHSRFPRTEAQCAY
uniref:Uncharacterized protein n=1 Tax=Arundo donax TaxID=35708 RepID=A0A0A9ET58_ARUDO